MIQTSKLLKVLFSFPFNWICALFLTPLLSFTTWLVNVNGLYLTLGHTEEESSVCPRVKYKPFTTCLTIERLGRAIIQQHNDVKLLHQKMLALRRLLPDNTPDNCCHVLNKSSVKGGRGVCVCNTYTSNINKSMTLCNQVDLAALSESKL